MPPVDSSTVWHWSTGGNWARSFSNPRGSLSNRFPVDMPRLVDMYMSGKLKLDEMISQRIKLEQVNEGFDDMKKGGLARSVIMFD